MNRRRKHLLLACLLTLTLSSCEVLDNLLSVGNLMNCEYALRDVSNVSIAGVNAKALANGQISATDVVKLAAALQSKSIPLAMNVNVDVTNPTANKAALTDMAWQLHINGSQFAQGTSTQTYTINPNSSAAVPLAVNTDLYSMFSKSGIEALKTFVKSFNSDGTSSNVAIKIRPSVNVGGQKIQSPEFITLNKKVGGKTQNTGGTATAGTATIKK